MIVYESRCLSYANNDENTFNDIARDVIERTEISDMEKYRITHLSKTKYEKLRKEFRSNDEDVSEYENNWEWNKDLKKYEYRYYPLGEYLPDKKKVILYKKNIEKVCAYDGVPFYCVVLTTFIHELFHAVHHKVAESNGRQYDYIREIEEAMTEFSTMVFLHELYSSYKLGDAKRGNWNNVYSWAKKSIERKSHSLGDLPAYGFGYHLCDTLYSHKPSSDDEAYKWIERYNQKVGAIDKKNRYVKFYQQMLNPVYPFKDEKLCLELLHSILFNL